MSAGGRGLWIRHGRVNQGLLWHANSRITSDIYQQTVTEERRIAQTLAFNALMGTESFSTLEHPESKEKAEVIIGCA